jgi:phosphoenolpyruvate synthase/pyruvate phosphate dikinase
MTRYVFAFHEGDKDQKDLLGGKGAASASWSGCPARG